jgi:D-xylose transport system substrate-binding protein
MPSKSSVIRLIAYSLTFNIIMLGILCTYSCNQRKPVVGLMFPHVTMKRYLIEKEIIAKKVSEAGCEFIFSEAQNDEEKQIQQFNDIIDKVDILILDPVNRFNAAQMVRKAHEKGIKIISYDRLISNAEVDAFITFDPVAIGKQMTDYVLKLIPTGNYIIIGGDKTDLNAIGIEQGQQIALETAIKNGNVKVTYKTFIEKWSADDAKFEVKNYLKLSGKTPDVILAAADGVSKGVVDALIEYHLQGSVLVTGNGGEVATCKNILLGNQVMTVYKPVKKLAKLAVDLSLKMLKDEKTDDILKSKINNGLIDVPSGLLETITVDAANLKSTVMADGLVTEEELK